MYPSPASSMACAGPVDAMTSTRMPPSRSRANAGPASFAERPPPAAGFTIAKNLSFNGPSVSLCSSVFIDRTHSHWQNRFRAVQLAQSLRQDVPLYLERSCTRKIFLVHHDSMNALVVKQPAIEQRDAFAQLFGQRLARLQVNHEHQLLANHRTLRPNVISGEDTKFLNGQALEDSLDVFRVNVLPFLGDDHIFLAAEKL